MLWRSVVGGVRLATEATWLRKACRDIDLWATGARVIQTASRLQLIHRSVPLDVARLRQSDVVETWLCAHAQAHAGAGVNADFAAIKLDSDADMDLSDTITFALAVSWRVRAVGRARQIDAVE
jgi:hypothetical protein